MFRRILLFPGLLGGVLSISTVHAQGHLWSQSFGDATFQSTRGPEVAVDPFGNVIIVGALVGSIDFGGGSLVTDGPEDIFIAKFDRDGRHLLSRRLGNAGWGAAFDVTTDSAGNIVVTGYFQDTVDFGGGPITGLAGSYGYSMFLAKFDPSGSHVWSLGSGTAGWAVGWRVAVDATDHVLAAVAFGGSVDFGGGPVTGQEALLIVKLGPTGNHTWTAQLPDLHEFEIMDIAVDPAGGTLVGGTYRYNLLGVQEESQVQSAGPFRQIRPADHQIYTFVAKFEADGDVAWTKRLGELDPPGVGVAFDPVGNATVAAACIGNVLVNGEFVLWAAAPSLLLLEFDAKGTLAWARNATSPGSVSVADLAQDGSGNLFVASQLWNRYRNGGAVPDVYLMKFDSSGNPLTSWQFGDGDRQYVESIAVDDPDAIVFAGNFEGTIDFGGGPLTSQGSFDHFLAKQSAVVTDAQVQGRYTLLGEPRPNPTAGSVRMLCAIPDGRPALIQVFDIKGRLVRTLVDGSLAPGNEVRWDGLDVTGARLPAAVYLVQLRHGGATETRRITLLR